MTAADMPLESSPDGLIKRLIHENMETGGCASTPTCSSLAGRSRASTATCAKKCFSSPKAQATTCTGTCHFDCDDKSEWSWETRRPRSLEWEQRRFHLYPALRHPGISISTTDSAESAGAPDRHLSNRIIKEMGFDWFEQVENAPGFDASKADGDVHR